MCMVASSALPGLVARSPWVAGCCPPPPKARRHGRRGSLSLAGPLVDDRDVTMLLTRLVGYSVRLLGADAGGVMLAEPRVFLVAAASSEDARLSELLELENGQGPCLDCVRRAAPVSMADLAAAAGRWPKFVAAAMRRPVFRAVHALLSRFNLSEPYVVIAAGIIGILTHG